MSELKEITIHDIISRKKQNSRRVDSRFIMKAYNYALEKHGEQKRNSGEPYIIHPLQVAYVLADMGLDEATIAAALLHDVVEDTDATHEDIAKEFGEEVAEMVEGVTKLSTIQFASLEENQVENYRKMFLAMGKDIRVILIKLSDRLHNMRTLKYLKRDRQIAISKETMDLYSPLANRLGLYSIKAELDDLSFKYLYPEEYREIVEGIDKKREERLKFLDKIMEDIRVILKKSRIDAEVTGRAKHFYSIYKKMQRDNCTLDQIYDLFAIRIIVNSVKDCYASLGIVHEMYNPMPGRFKDYIAVPKPNMYQSIHTTLLGEKGTPFEVQIRTWDMHKVAEFGIAAHWAYKEANFLGIGKQNVKVKQDELAWLRETIEWQKEMQDPQEFLETLKTELFEDEVYVFTPKGKIKVLPKGANAIDFAYNIHAEIGHHMVGCKINSKMMPILTPLKSGDIVEIITSDNSKGPSMDWLKFVKSSSARNKINGWFKKENREENIEKGKELIEKEIKRISIDYAEIFKPEYIKPMLDRYKYENMDQMYAAVGFGANTANKVIARMLIEYRKYHQENNIEEEIKKLATEKQPQKSKQSSNGIIVKGIDNCLVKLSRCCNPLPGDEIVGYITKGRGVSVHRKDCINVKELIKEENRMIDVAWVEEEKLGYKVDIEIDANDRNNLLSDVIATLSNAKVKLVAVSARASKDRIATIDATLETQGVDDLNNILKALRKIDSVYEVKRKKI